MHLSEVHTMLTAIIPKLPMRDAVATRTYYVDQLGFKAKGHYPDYLIVERDGLELHFFLFADLDPLTNDGQVYIRVADIDTLYQALVDRGMAIHPNGSLGTKPWGQREFALLDPDHNLLTFGQPQ
jgi:catechol 2,3-dioxygenase-like lactoylglutathione lyase family enzyme